MRRGSGRRVDFPVYRSACRQQEAYRAFVAAVDDSKLHRGRFRETPWGPRVAPFGRRGGVPLRIGLAHRHKRHACHDGFQLEGRRFLQDHGRPRADTDTRDSRRARGSHTQFQGARLLGDPRHVCRCAGGVCRPLVRRGLPEGRRRGKAREALGREAGRGHPREVPGKVGRRHRGGRTGIAALPAVLRPAGAAGRSERPVRLLSQNHARARPGALRKTQGPHLSEDRFSRIARGLSRHGQEDARHVRGAEIGLHAPRSSDTEERLGQAEQTHLRQQKDFRPLRNHPHDAETGESSSLVAIKNGEKGRTREVEVRANQTKPPARFTEATLLSAMEGAGKLVEDEELREAMSEKGLGTPATRAQIIEGLIYEDYVHRVGRELQPTPKASSLLFALRHFGVNELCSPELTGNWEFKLKQMEHGTLPRSEFMDHIVDLTREMVSRIKRGEIPDTVFLTLKTPCPKCGGTVQENYRKFKCQKCDFSIWKVVSSREFAPEEIESLITKRSVGPLTGFRSRVGKPFAAMVRLTPEFRAEFDFGRQADADGTAAKVDFSGLTPLGPCPKCGGRVFEQPMAYICENSANPTQRCDFRSGRVILQRPIEPEEIKKLLATGKTDLLHRFISRKGRPFSAFLVRAADGKVGFEFAPRATKPRSPARTDDTETPPTKTKTESKPRTSVKRLTGRARVPRNKRAA